MRARRRVRRAFPFPPCLEDSPTDERKTDAPTVSSVPTAWQPDRRRRIYRVREECELAWGAANLWETLLVPGEARRGGVGAIISLRVLCRAKRRVYQALEIVLPDTSPLLSQQGAAGAVPRCGAGRGPNDRHLGLLWQLSAGSGQNPRRRADSCDHRADTSTFRPNGPSAPSGHPSAFPLGRRRAEERASQWALFACRQEDVRSWPGAAVGTLPVERGQISPLVGRAGAEV
jgi:hypothetical protein